MSSKKITVLPDGFNPGANDVIVGRGKVCYKHSGNQRLTKIVQSVLSTYSASEATKKSKSELIKSIMVQIRESSPDGGFVKFDNEAGQWFEVGDRIAREKVSQTFRDALNDRYKSSTTSKTLKRRQERINRQTSAGSRDGSCHGAPRTMIDQHEISGAQARVDALLMAANASSGGKHMLPHPSFSSLPPLTPGMSSFAHLGPAGLMPGGGGASPQGLPMATMTPSLTSLMAENTAAAQQANYGQMFLNRELENQGQLKRSLMGSLYQTSME